MRRFIRRIPFLSPACKLTRTWAWQVRNALKICRGDAPQSPDMVDFQTTAVLQCAEQPRDAPPLGIQGSPFRAVPAYCRAEHPYILLGVLPVFRVAVANTAPEGALEGADRRRAAVERMPGRVGFPILHRNRPQTGGYSGMGIKAGVGPGVGRLADRDNRV